MDMLRRMMVQQRADYDQAQHAIQHIANRQQDNEHRQRGVEAATISKFNEIGQKMQDLPGIALGAVAQQQEQLNRMAKQIEELQVQRRTPSQGARAARTTSQWLSEEWDGTDRRR